MKKRKFYDYAKFQHLKESQDVVYELINGMQEIKLNVCETVKRRQWEEVQVGLFKVNSKSLLLEQYQRVGFKFINYSKNLLISYFAASEAIQGNITLGMLLSISYILGQINTPLDQLIPSFRAVQDTKISLDRLQEIHHLKNEQEYTKKRNLTTNDREIIKGVIRLKNVSFRYGGPRSPFVLKNINMVIPEGKVTAIVGNSGSGKTTLMKLLLKFYEPTNGYIELGVHDLNTIDAEEWRKKCGIVMQNGYIFSDTIANNISLNGIDIDSDYNKHIDKAADMANISQFIKSFPLGYNTRLGNGGGGISVGQKQRILIARAIYKNPAYIFLDEATSALDANNEKVIIENLNKFFSGRTVVVIAHRLSTVKQADQIVVLDNGIITEMGTHNDLIKLKKDYFHLVKNQLELGE